MALRSATYRLYPTVKQIQALTRLLDVQRRVYNAALEERIGVYEWSRGQRKVTLYDQQKQLAGMEIAKQYGTRVCRGTLLRLDRAFNAFFRRLKAGETPGFPRFKSAERWDSVEWTDPWGWGLVVGAGRLRIQGIGHVKAKFHRTFDGAEPRTLVTRAQRRLDGCKRGSNRRKRAKARVRREHEKIANVRKDAAHKLSRDLVDAFDMIAMEDLKPSKMTRRPKPKPDPENPGAFLPNGAAAKSGLNKSILDAGWGMLRQFTTYKAEDAGRTIKLVDPRYTSQTCAECGITDAASRVSRSDFACTACGHTAHADANAARVILAVAQGRLKIKGPGRAIATTAQAVGS